MFFQQYVAQPVYAFMPQQPQQAYRPPEFKSLSMTISLPSYSYNTSKVASVPFDIKESNNGRFPSVEDAMRFIAKHCMKHHNQFTRQLAKQYSPHCFVMDFISGQYVPLTETSKREFSSAFNKVSKFVH